MRRYLLDTAPLAGLLSGRPAAVSLITPWITRGEVATSILVYGEVIEYLKGRRDYPAHRQGLRTLDFQRVSGRQTMLVNVRTQ